MCKVIRHDMLCMAKEVFRLGRMGEFQNKRLIKLIPKNLAKDTVGAWHPITLPNVLNMILGKVLALRIQ